MAPMCGIDDRLKPHPISISLLMFLSNYLPTLPVLKTQDKMNSTCKNEEYMLLKEKSEYYYHGRVRLNTARECYYTSLWIKEHGKLFNAPLFLIHGLDDTITNPDLSIDFFNNVPNKNKKIYLPKNTHHSLTLKISNDDHHPKLVWIKILKWISLTLKPL